MSEAEYSIGRHCGVTFAGIKPASLVSLHRGDGAIVARLARCFRRRGFAFEAMPTQGGRLNMYVYHAERLRGVLFEGETRAFLAALGYRYGTVREAVAELKARMAAGRFPHEVGVFLGYPLADVRGFMHDPHGGVLCGCWKVYADAAAAERTFERYRRCSACICRMMDNGKSLAQIFRVG